MEVTENQKIAVLVPCFNEASTVGEVVQGYSDFLGDSASVFVFDNNSTDNTAEFARQAGAIVRCEPLQGKGNVVRRMFADVEADIYVLVDGDLTYDIPSVKAMIEMLVKDELDMVTGVRVTEINEAYRFGHRFGNWMLTTMVKRIFGTRLTDMLSGYRVFSRRYVKSFVGHSSGFEIETELSVHALNMRMPIKDIETPYYARPEGSVSKLNTYKDGVRIFGVIVGLIRDEKPLLFFGMAGSLSIILSLAFSYPVIAEYIETGLVPRLPTAVLSTGLALLGVISFVSGLILDSVAKGRREAKRLHYLKIPV